MSPQVVFWLVAIVIFAILEAATAALVSVWFIAGSIGALVVTLCGGGKWPQLIVFLVVSVIVLLIVRPLVKKYVTPNKVSTNNDRYIGAIAVVTEDINNIYATGAVKVSGVEWTARSEAEGIIPAGSLVKITRIEGAKLFVEPAPVLETQTV